MMRNGKRSPAMIRSASLAASLFAMALFCGTEARALGTASGTQIGNTATALYSIGGATQPLVSSGPSATFTVDNKVNLTVANFANATVVPGSTDRALVFSVTNNGNTAQAYRLNVVSRGTDSFNMNNIRIYRDVNNNGTLELGTDALYADPATFGSLASDATFTVLVVADTPGALSSGSTAVQDLVATTYDAGGLVVTAQSATATAAVDVVFADIAGSDSADIVRDGGHSAAGTFTVSGTAVIVSKAVTVIDQSGGSSPVAGATLRYTITVTVSGGGTANSVVITDPIPANTTYLAGTLRLNGAPLTDIIDVPTPDAGDAGATTPGAVTVNLGNMTAASPAHTIVFDVRID